MENRKKVCRLCGQEYTEASSDDNSWQNPVHIENRTYPPSIDALFAALKEEYFNSDILFLKKETAATPSTLPDSVLQQLFGKQEATMLPDSVSNDKCTNSEIYDGDTLEGDEAIVLPDSLLDEAIVLPDSLLDDICFDFDALEREGRISNTADEIPPSASSSSFPASN